MFTISWRPFYLDPTSPEKGIPLKDRFQQRFEPEKAAALIERLRTIGTQEGIAFSFAGRIGRTRDSHRLIELAGREANGGGIEVQNAVVLALFQSYFEGEGDITGLDTLVEAGVKGGLDSVKLRNWLELDTGGEEVDREVEEARVKGISGVPYFRIQGVYEVDGAQDPQDFMEAFVKVKESEA